MCLHHPEQVKLLPKKLSRRVRYSLTDLIKTMHRIIGPHEVEWWSGPTGLFCDQPLTRQMKYDDGRDK